MSQLDTGALNLFRTIDAMDATAVTEHASPSTALYLMSGHDLEKWLLKTLIGLAVSGAVQWTPLSEDQVALQDWASALFEPSLLQPPRGLYVPTAIAASRAFKREFALTLIHRSDHRLAGLLAELNGYPLFLLMEEGTPPDRRDYFRIRHVYRPFEFHTTAGDHEYSVLFSWEGPAEKGTINFEQGAV